MLNAGAESPLVDEFGRDSGSIDVGRYFREVPFTEETVGLAPRALRLQSLAVLDYFRNYKNQDPTVVKAGILSAIGVTLADVETTLNFLSDIIARDTQKKRPSRLRDPLFIKKHFRVIHWKPRGSGGEGSRKLRITKYAVFTIKGSIEKSSFYNCALYRLPGDEAGLSLKEAEANKSRLKRFRYTKQQVLAGAYNNGGAKPLVWVARNGLEEALMEGSICVELPDGKKRFFNVDRNNGIAYNRSIKNPRKQSRYWYFGEVAHPQGYGMDVKSQIPIFDGAAVAGDVYNLGLGKLIGISYNSPEDGKQKMNLVILADTGGAFTPNLKQLDYYMGVFQSQNHFKTKQKSIPMYSKVYILIKKQKD
ncbi:MAG: hypothetical protein GY757_38130 [bacterium]|nr:hypothetical protein [bacterium]